MGQIAEIFNNSLMRALAAQAEEKRFQQEFAYRDQRAKEEDAFRQLQFNQTVAMAEEANKDRDLARADARLARFESQYDPITPGSPMFKMLGKSGLDLSAAASQAGSAFDGSTYDPNTRWVSRTDVQNERDRMNMERQLALVDAKQRQAMEEYNAPLKAWSDFVNTNVSPTLQYESTKDVPYGPQKETFLSKIGSMLRGEESQGLISNVEKIKKEYINPEYLNQFGDAYANIAFQQGKSPLAKEQMAEALSVLENQFTRFGEGDQLGKFISNMNEYGYGNRLNANALLALKAALTHQQDRSVVVDKARSAEALRVLELMTKQQTLLKLQGENQKAGYSPEG